MCGLQKVQDWGKSVLGYLCLYVANCVLVFYVTECKNMFDLLAASEWFIINSMKILLQVDRWMDIGFSVWSKGPYTRTLHNHVQLFCTEHSTSVRQTSRPFENLTIYQTSQRKNPDKFILICCGFFSMYIDQFLFCLLFYGPILPHFMKQRYFIELFSFILLIFFCDFSLL